MLQRAYKAFPYALNLCGFYDNSHWLAEIILYIVASYIPLNSHANFEITIWFKLVDLFYQIYYYEFLLLCCVLRTLDNLAYCEWTCSESSGSYKIAIHLFIVDPGTMDFPFMLNRAQLNLFTEGNSMWRTRSVRASLKSLQLLIYHHLGIPQ